MGASEVLVPEPVLRELEAHGLDDPTVRAIRDQDWINLVAGPKIAPAIAAWDLGAGGILGSVARADRPRGLGSDRRR